MKRRTFLCGLTLGALTSPLAAEAQVAGKVPRVGFVEAGSRSANQHFGHPCDRLGVGGTPWRAVQVAAWEALTKADVAAA